MYYFKRKEGKEDKLLGKIDLRKVVQVQATGTVLYTVYKQTNIERAFARHFLTRFLVHTCLANCVGCGLGLRCKGPLW